MITLARTPQGVPLVSDFQLTHQELPDLQAAEVRLVTRWLSLDPYLRGILSGRHLGHRIAPGDVIPGSVAGQIVASGDPAWRAGDWALLDAGWRSEVVAPAAALQRWDPALGPPSSALGVLGMPGLTAWAGITRIAQVASGDTVLVSAASGAVGGTAGQLALAAGARVIGIAGGAAKCAFVTSELGFAACIDHRDPEFSQLLRAAAPDGIDVYFDNVGGSLLSAALGMLRKHARVVLCGLIDQYNQATPPPGPNLGPVIGARATLHGLVVYDWFGKRAQFLAEVAPLVKSGRVRYREDIMHGLGNAPEAFCRLMRGENFGKALVQL